MTASAERESPRAWLGLECAWASSGDDAGTWRAVASSPSGDVMVTVGHVLCRGRLGEGADELAGTASALAREGHTPDDVVWHLRHRAETAGMRARFLLAVFRLGDGRLQVHSGGHRPPLVAGPAGEASMALRPSPALGDGRVRRPRWEWATIGAGDTVLFPSGPEDTSMDVYLLGSLSLRRSDPLVGVCRGATQVWPGGGRSGTILAVRVTDQL